MSHPSPKFLLAAALLACMAVSYGVGAADAQTASSTSPPLLAPDTAVWWAGAVAAFARGKTLEPTTMDILIEELANDGSVTSREKARTMKLADGSTIVVFAEKNGKDTTAEYRKRIESMSGGANAGKPPKGFDASPFDPAWQSAIRTQTAVRKGDLVEVPYTIRSRDADITGIARFSVDGEPISASQRWEKTPPFVTAISSSIEYIARGGSLFAERLASEGKVDALVFRRGFRFTMQFSEWRTISP